jgi:hypothetical protein
MQLRDQTGRFTRFSPQSALGANLNCEQWAALTPRLFTRLPVDVNAYLVKVCRETQSRLAVRCWAIT